MPAPKWPRSSPATCTTRILPPPTTPTQGRCGHAACRAYVLAAERAESVGAPEAAEAAYLRAAELSSDEAEQADWIERAGRLAFDAGWSDRAINHLERAIAAHNEAGRVVDAARVTARLGAAFGSCGRGEQAITVLRAALATLDEDAAPPEVLAALYVQLGSVLFFAGHTAEAAAPTDVALMLAQHHRLAEPLAVALSACATILHNAGRNEEARLLYEGSGAAARLHGITRSEMQAENNLADLCMSLDLPEAEEHARAALALTQRWGLRSVEALTAGNLMYILTMSGRLDEAYRTGTELLLAGGDERPGAHELNYRLACVEVLRGNAGPARDLLDRSDVWKESDSVQDKVMFSAADAAVSLVAGDSRRALELALAAVDEAVKGGLAISHESVRLAFPTAIEAGIAAGEEEQASQLVEFVAGRHRGEVPPFLWAQVARGRALLARARGDDAGVEEGLAGAEAGFRELGYPYWTARTQLERAEWLVEQGRGAEAGELLVDATAAFETAGVPPMVERARALAGDLVRGPRAASGVGATGSA